MDAEFLKGLQKRVGQSHRIDQREVLIDHQETAVDVDVVARQLDDVERDALAGQHLAHLPRALGVDAHANADRAVGLVEPRERATLHHARARDGAQDWHAELGERLRRHQLFAAANARPHPVDDRTALDHLHGVACVDGLEVAIADAFLVDHLDTTALECRDESVVLGLHDRNVRRIFALEVPVLGEVAVRANRVDALAGIDDVHLNTGPVHKDRTDLADIVVDAPGPAPGRSLLGRILEGGLTANGEHLDGLVVDPHRVEWLAH